MSSRLFTAKLILVCLCAPVLIPLLEFVVLYSPASSIQPVRYSLRTFTPQRIYMMALRPARGRPKIVVLLPGHRRCRGTAFGWEAGILDRIRRPPGNVLRSCVTAWVGCWAMRLGRGVSCFVQLSSMSASPDDDHEVRSSRNSLRSR